MPVLHSLQAKAGTMSCMHYKIMLHKHDHRTQFYKVDGVWVIKI